MSESSKADGTSVPVFPLKAPRPGGQDHIIEPERLGARQFDNVGRIHSVGMNLRSKGLFGSEVGAGGMTAGPSASQTGSVGVPVATTVDPGQASPASAHVVNVGRSGVSSASHGAMQTDSEMMSDARAFDIIKKARAVVQEDKAQRKKRKDSPACETTQDDYAQKCKLIDDALDALDEMRDFETPTLVHVLMRYADKKSSFYKMRAALKWRCLNKLKQLLSAQDAMQRAGQRDPAWRQCISAVGAALMELDEIRDASHAECLAYSGREVRRTESKKEVLRRLQPGWKDAFLKLSAQSLTYRAPALLMCLCGFRPAELSKFRVLNDGGKQRFEQGVLAVLQHDHVLVTIPGAKVRDSAGQPERCFALRREALPGWFIEELLPTGSKSYAQVPANVSRHFDRISVKLYPRKHSKNPKDVRITPYVFRHALVTELRRAGWETEEIAAVLGESVSETVRHYGLRAGPGTIEPGQVAVARHTTTTTREVRTVDRRGLDKLLGDKKAAAPG